MIERQTVISLVIRIPSEDRDRLKALSARTRIRQSEYLREGLADLLELYGDGEGPPFGFRSGVSRRVATNVLVPAAMAQALRALSGRTRIAQVDYFCQAVSRVLYKHERHAGGEKAAADVEAKPMRAAVAAMKGFGA